MINHSKQNIKDNRGQNINQHLELYSPIMAFSGYFMIFLLFSPISPVSILLLLIPFIGSVVFLNYLKERNDENNRWKAGIIYPALFAIIIALTIYSALNNFLYVFFPIHPGYFIIPYLCIAPASLSLFAAMPKVFREKLNLNIILVSILSVLIVMLPLYDKIIGFLNPESVSDYMYTDVTGGFIIMIFIVFLGMPVLFISGIYSGYKISKMIKEEIICKNNSING